MNRDSGFLSSGRCWRGCGGHDLRGAVREFNRASPHEARAFLPEHPFHEVWCRLGDPDVPGGHADSFSTSISLHLRPATVRVNEIRDPDASACRLAGFESGLRALLVHRGHWQPHPRQRPAWRQTLGGLCRECREDPAGNIADLRIYRRSLAVRQAQCRRDSVDSLNQAPSRIRLYSRGPLGLRQCRAHQRQDLAVLRMAPQLLLREHQVAVNDHLKHSAARRHQRHFAHVGSMLSQDLFRRTDGFREIVSLAAVFDRNSGAASHGALPRAGGD